MSPEIIIHSDWSTARDKRWLAEAAFLYTARLIAREIGIDDEA